MSQKLPVDGFKWFENASQFNKYLVRITHCFLKFMLKISKNYLHNDLRFLPERKKLKKLKNLQLAFMVNKYVIHISNLMQALNHGLLLEKVYGVIKFNQ